MSVYFDYNATAPLRASSKKVMLEAMDFLGNASSVHSFGREVRRKIEFSRGEIAGVLDIEAKRVIFTSGATESNNLALKNFPGRAIVSAIEHDSILRVREDLIVVPVLADGTVDLEKLEATLSKDFTAPTLVSIMAANNETGIIQPLAEIIQIAKKHGAYVHSDAVQAVGRLNFPWQTLDMVSISAHKLGGPSGIGCLVINPNLPLIPHIRGGGQERSYRAGTENLLGIAGMAAALRDSAQDNLQLVERLRDDLEDLICQVFPESLVLNRNVPRLSNTALFHMPGVKSETQVMNFDLEGFAVSAGSACSSGKVKASAVLKAMGLDDDKSSEMIRISLGPKSTRSEIEAFAQVWQSIYQKCSPLKNLERKAQRNGYESVCSL